MNVQIRCKPIWCVTTGRVLKTALTCYDISAVILTIISVNMRVFGICFFWNVQAHMAVHQVHEMRVKVSQGGVESLTSIKVRRGVCVPPVRFACSRLLPRVTVTLDFQSCMHYSLGARANRISDSALFWLQCVSESAPSYRVTCSLCMREECMRSRPPGTGSM